MKLLPFLLLLSTSLLLPVAVYDASGDWTEETVRTLAPPEISGGGNFVLVQLPGGEPRFCSLPVELYHLKPDTTIRVLVRRGKLTGFFYSATILP